MSVDTPHRKPCDKQVSVAKEINMPVISTNNAANAALNYLNINSAQETDKLSQLASGSRIVQASDDAAGLAIGTQLNANVTVYNQDSVNVAQGTAILQSTDGALAQISNVLQRMMSLATSAASGQVTNDQRSQDINTEYKQLSNEITSIVGSTTYAGQALLSGSFLSNVKFLVGTLSSNFISLSLATVSVSGLLGTTGSSVSTAALALQAMSKVSSAINTITQDRALVGAYESQFNFSGQDISTNIQNISAAASVIMDADVASVKAGLSANDVKTQASVAALTQAAQLPQELLKLLQS
jgi:flagellin